MSTSSDEWRSKSPELKQASAISALTAAIVSTPALSVLWPEPQTVAPVSAPKGPVVMPQLYSRIQTIVQKMLHSDHGVPIRSHKRRLISAIPSAFTGADMVLWLQKELYMPSKVEAIHVANMLSKQGFFFCVEGYGIPIRDDNTLYRFQTPYYWPSQNPPSSDFEYGVYLVKQVLRSKHRIRLLNYELNNLHKLKLRLAKQWKLVTEKADEDVRIFREQKRVAKAIMSSQEEAYWRLRRPPPRESGVGDALLTRHGTERSDWRPQKWTEESLRNEVSFLKQYLKRTRVHMSTALEGTTKLSQKYQEFDPMLTSPQPSNPWITGDDTLWTIEKSLVEHPSERQVRRWACSFLDLLTDVTGRYNFEEYCKAQYNSENIRFWQACRDLKSIPLAAVAGSVKLIFDEFLQRSASSEVNVSANVQEEIEKDLKSPSRYAFCSAQLQIFQLMQNDIYARFLKSPDYQQMLSVGKMQGTAGKSFFSRFKVPSANRQKLQAQVSTDFTSPCLPGRYTKRQLSISRKLSSSNATGSLDDLFLASSPSTESKRISAYTEAFIETLTAPDPGGMQLDHVRHRRVSAPLAHILPGKPKQLQGSLDQVFEEDSIEATTVEVTGKVAIDIGLPTSYSYDDIAQLKEDAELVAAPKWARQTGEKTPKDVAASSYLSVASNALHPSRSIPASLSEQKNDLLQVPEFSLAGSSPSKSYEFESINHGKVYSSTESVHSTASH